MSTLSITRNYLDGDDLTEAQLDAANDSIETWANGNVGSTNIATSGVDTTNIAASAVTAAKIASDAVTTAKILDANVTTAKIADLNVTTGKINDLAVTTGKINTNAVTRAKLEAFGQQISDSCGNFTTTSATFTPVTNLSVSLTTTGRPVFLGLVADGNTTNSSWLSTNNGTSSTVAFFQGATQLTQAITSSAAATNATLPPGSFWHVYVPAAGTYTYTLQVAQSSSNTTTVRYCKLVAFEY